MGSTHTSLISALQYTRIIFPFVAPSPAGTGTACSSFLLPNYLLSHHKRKTLYSLYSIFSLLEDFQGQRRQVCVSDMKLFV
uniref:Uncharacterized protein n=1 Tax=Salix viminalis TaxID=40686 RepID=A0A6N2NG34_SALVM